MPGSFKKRHYSLTTSESVTLGHPDKVSDYISDSILDELLVLDPNARVAVESVVSRDNVFLVGEVSTVADVDDSFYGDVARRSVAEVGYTYDGFGFSDKSPVSVNISRQSPDIARGVDLGGAGDQGVMFGGAWSETESGMPISTELSRAMSIRLYDLFLENREGERHLYPDGKTQVTVAFSKGHVVDHVDTVVVSASHTEGWGEKGVSDFIVSEVVKPVLNDYGFDPGEVKNIFVNPTGRFVEHGPAVDAGLTGRKIIVDSYGGVLPHGGGAFSGKDPSKVDRSAAYMARYIAKNVVASKLANRCEVQLAYAIGVNRPVSVNLNMFGVTEYPVGLVAKAVYHVFDMTPNGIQRDLDLRGGVKYAPLSIYGHFGDFGDELPWERVDKADKIRQFCADNFIER